ncbi:hypothetical protein [Acidisoma silvae]|uniref:Uncharacterized protein n=1 Tax=Acidisoma silvae TaxID=2802396 RepID=A0A963YVF8_9PROT|nr:hypothetical protein [Acidisoma silvae]MCB8877586.1 hypothetical protein [Acidisoma silvae]
MKIPPPFISRRLVATVVFVEGQDAFDKGLSLTENPYRKDNPLARNAWEDGWITAAREASVK